MPGPLENLADALATGLPRLKSLNLSRDALADADVLYLCGSTRERNLHPHATHMHHGSHFVTVTVLLARRPGIEHLDLAWNRMTDTR
jgi:hypothetical protein